MTDEVKIQLILAAAPTLLALGTLIVGIATLIGQFRNHKLMNSRLTELLNARGQVEHAAGVAQERAEARSRDEATKP